MGVVDFLSSISGIVSSVAVVASFIVAYCVYRDSGKPYVVVFLEHDRDHECLSLVVSNLGKSAAKDIVFSDFNYSFVGNEFRNYIDTKSFLKKGIPVLVPGASRSTVILAGSMSSFADTSDQVKIAYKKKSIFRFWLKRTDYFTLDYYSFAGSVYLKSDLHRVAVALEKIAEGPA